MARRPKDDLKARLVDAVGARYVDATQTSLETLGKTFDIIIEGTGNASVALDAMNHLSTNGVLCLLGVYNASQSTFQFGDLLREMVLRNKLLFGSVNANKRYFEMGLIDFRQVKQRFGDVLSRMFTQVLRPEEFKQAFDPQPEDIKTVINFV